MYFTLGGDRAFESLMQGKPGFDHYDSGDAGATPERRRIAATAVFTVPTGSISFACMQSVPTSRASSPPLKRFYSK